ncbi:unnamed protein product, partial [Brassica napus]
TFKVKFNLGKKCTYILYRLFRIPMRSKRSDGGLPQKTLPSPAQPLSENQRTAAEEQRRNEKIVRFTELSREARRKIAPLELINGR